MHFLFHWSMKLHVENYTAIFVYFVILIDRDLLLLYGPIF